LAAFLGVGVRSIENYVADGMPERKDAAGRYYHVADCWKWRIENDKVHGVPGRKPTRRSKYAEEIDELNVRMKRIEAEETERNHKLKMGELVEADMAEAHRAECVQVVKRDFTLMVPYIAPKLEGQSRDEIEARLMDAVMRICNAYAAMVPPWRRRGKNPQLRKIP